MACRASAQAIFVAAILSAKSSSKAFAIFLLFDALASGVVKHRHVALFEGEVAAVVLLDGHALQSTSATATYFKAPASGDIFSISWS